MNVERMRRHNDARKVRGRWTAEEVAEIQRLAAERMERLRGLID